MRVGLCSLVFVVFLTLKLTDQINWSWAWVTAPLWGPLALMVGVIVLAMVFGLIFDRPNMGREVK